MEKKILTVSQLTHTISLLLDEGIGFTTVQGEISNYKLHSSGHRYFTLKDEGASISCTMWRGKGNLSFQPTDGMKVVITGNLTVYPPRGQYQIECESMTPLGKGDLYLAFEALKVKLEEKGYFSPVHKKRLPSIPISVGVSTSPTGAAVKDIFSTINRRFPACTIYFRPTLVQGDGSSEDIVMAIDELQKHNVNVIIIGRGGGSLEDLWSYNTELVADAIYNCRVPIISAVGHETDWTIADFVADVRAATPTAAAELVTPRTKDELLSIISNETEYLKKLIIKFIEQQKDYINDFTKSRSVRNILDKIRTYSRQIDENESRMTKTIQQNIVNKKQNLNMLENHCRSLHPFSPLKKGFAILKSSGKYIKPYESLSRFKNIEIVREDEMATAKIVKILPKPLFE
jgi:exodeoxyribonuclease VII large subunit